MEQSRSISEEAEVPEALAGKRLDAVAARLFPDHSRARLRAWIEAGALTCNGLPAARPRDPVAAGDYLRISADVAVPEAAAMQPQDIAFDVLHADDDIIVLDKPAGLTVHPGAGAPDGTLQNALLHRFPDLAALPRAGIVHRLDKLTSGVLVVARTPAAHTALVRMLQARDIGREYDALVWGRLVSGGRVDAPIGRDPRSRLKMAVTRGGREAVTHYRVHARFGWHTHLRVTLETGRTHQIRVHMQHIKHPIIGDDSYGGRRGHGRGIPETLREALVAFPRQALHARRLQLKHPASDAVMVFEASLPADLAALLAQLQQDSPDRGD